MWTGLDLSVGLKAKEQALLPFNSFVLMSPKSWFDLGRKECFQADLKPHLIV